MVGTVLLVVEDDEALRGTLVGLFKDEGYETAGAADGREALVALLGAERPMVVLLDILLPILTGDQLLRMVLYTPSLQQHAYIVYTAADASVTAEVRNLLDNLRVPLIAKPFDLDALVGTAHEAAHRIAQAGS